jgi:hypothetical protein
MNNGSDIRGFFIECIARNVSLKNAAEYLDITEEQLQTKLLSEELLTLDDAARLQGLLSIRGSRMTVDNLFAG